MEVGTAYVSVRPDLSRFATHLSNDLNRTVSASRSRWTRAGRTLGLGIAAGVGAALAGAAVVGKWAVEQAVEAEKVGAQIEAGPNPHRSVPNRPKTAWTALRIPARTDSVVIRETKWRA